MFFVTSKFERTNCQYLLLYFAIICTLSVISQASCSAIPMWEFLSRAEKMSHLFNTFAKQAAEYCKSSTMPDCNKVLLVYGLINLAKMNDASLDVMDPYQRGANDKIWESMMKDSYRDTRNRVTSQSQEKQAEHERDYYADALEPSTDENYLESASNNVEENISGDSDNYMMGPMIVRVRIDGSPIHDHQQTHLPKDEDMEEHIAMRSKTVPSVSQLQELFSPLPSHEEFTVHTRTRADDRVKYSQSIAPYPYAYA